MKLVLNFTNSKHAEIQKGQKSIIRGIWHSLRIQKYDAFIKDSGFFGRNQIIVLIIGECQTLIANPQGFALTPELTEDFLNNSGELSRQYRHGAREV